MRGTTVKEFVKAFENQLVEVRQEDEYGNGITIDMSKARLEYSEKDDELYFTAGNYNADGIGAFCVKNTEENIESITEDDGYYIIEFTHSISNIAVTKFKNLDELEKERIQKKKRNFEAVLSH